MRMRTGVAYAALGLASVGVIGAGIETIRNAEHPTADEIAHSDNATTLKYQIDSLSQNEPETTHDELRKKQALELIAVSSSEWERDNKQLLGFLVSCAGAGALALGGAKIFIDERHQ